MPAPAAGAEAAQAGSAVRLEVARGRAVITLARPPVNVLDIATLHLLAARLREVPPQARVLLLRTVGRVFCAGMDIADHLPPSAPAMLEAAREVFAALLAVPCPVVAAVQGAALGGGAELLLLCDVVVASEQARLGFPEVQVGAFPPLAAVLLPERLGWQRAWSLMAPGEAISALEAAALGLVTQVVAPEALEEAVSTWVARYEDGLSGPVMVALKQAARGERAASLLERLREAERIYCERLLNLADAEEGLRAFQEKRAAAWSHT